MRQKNLSKRMILLIGQLRARELNEMITSKDRWGRKTGKQNKKQEKENKTKIRNGGQSSVTDSG